MDEFNWGLFLDMIVGHDVVPVIGSDLILVNKHDNIIPLYSYLLEKLEIKLNKNPGELDFREFILEYRDDINYTTVKNILKQVIEENILVTDHLKKLARISDFPFYISTTYDNFFEEILQNEIGRLKLVKVVDCSPNLAPSDQSKYEIDDKEFIVFKVLGSIEGQQCAITEDSIMENIYALNQGKPILKILEKNIKDKELLFLGCDFPNWLLRFFIRFLTDTKFKDDAQPKKYIAENYALRDIKLSVFLKHFKTQIIRLTDDEFKNPVYFIDKLYDKWIQRKGNEIPKKYEGLVFLSYNHRDKETVLKVRDELKANGINVWCDESELKSGDDYTSVIKQKIGQCKFFVPFISENSIADKSSYVYEKEWFLADVLNMAKEIKNEKDSFILPLIIDETDVTDNRIPAAFRKLTIQKFDLKKITNLLTERLELINDD